MKELTFTITIATKYIKWIGLAMVIVGSWLITFLAGLGFAVEEKINAKVVLYAILSIFLTIVSHFL